MCCDQLGFFLHERFVFEVDGLMWLAHLGSWVSAQSLAWWTMGDQRNPVSTAKCLLRG